MKKKVLSVIIGLTLILTLALSSLPGCGGGGGGASPTATTQPTVPPASDVIKFRWQHNLAADNPLYFVAEDLAKDLQIGSNGRLELEVLPQGTVCGNLEILDKVGDGTIDVGTSTDSLWGERDPRFYLVGNITGGMTVDEAITWLIEDTWAKMGGGWQMANDVFAKYNCIWLFWDLGAPLQDYISNKPLVSNTDYKGVKVRATGWAAKVLAEPEFGAVVSDEAEGDIYAALEKGAIDAAFAGSPSENALLGLDKVGKYAGFPGMQATMRTGSLLVNTDKWNLLPGDIQMLFQQLCQKYAMHNYAYRVNNDTEAFNAMKAAGVQTITQNEDCQRAWVNASWRLADEIAAKDAEFKKGWDVLQEVFAYIRPYFKLQTPNYEDIQ
ncbi:MAG: hypothetical protein ABIB93_05400 [Chloroflexota bacterium]